MMDRSRAFPLLIAVAMSLPSFAGAQRLLATPGLRFDAPLSAILEVGLMLKTIDEPQRIAGPSITAAAGFGGQRFGIGARKIGAMGVNASAQAVLVRTERMPFGAPPGKTYVGIEGRTGIVFTSLGLGVLVRTKPDGGGRWRLTASLGMGL